MIIVLVMSSQLGLITLFSVLATLTYSNIDYKWARNRLRTFTKHILRTEWRIMNGSFFRSSFQDEIFLTVNYFNYHLFKPFSFLTLKTFEE